MMARTMPAAPPPYDAPCHHAVPTCHTIVHTVCLSPPTKQITVANRQRSPAVKWFQLILHLLHNVWAFLVTRTWQDMAIMASTMPTAPTPYEYRQG